MTVTGRATLQVELARMLAFRARAMELHRRLPHGSWRAAASGGLQDTVPRAALAALHARVEGVEPASWEDPALVQTWFRASDYVLPAADFAVFTLGALPRDPERAAELEAVATAIADVLDGMPMRSGDVNARLPEAFARRGGDPARLPAGLRTASVTGRYRIRWDARTVTVLPAEPPAADPEEARLELARRFLRWHGPATALQFGKWSAGSRTDAARTWAALTPELVPVAMDGEARHLLARDEAALRGARPAAGVRLLPAGDPYLSVDKALVDAGAAAVPPPTCDEAGKPLTARVVRSLGTRHVFGARLLVDGRIVGAWAREQDRMVIYPWRPDDPDLERILAEAATMAGPMGRPMRVRLLRCER